MESVLILAGPDILTGGLSDPDGDHEQIVAVDMFPLLAHLLGRVYSFPRGKISQDKV